MLENITTQRTQQFLDFSSLLKEPKEPSFAAHAQLLEKLTPIAFAGTCRFLTIQSLYFEEICQKIVQKQRE